jgi:2',3'-cyclic-nucleotide 2'-phosphodiesterase (5'-nucleotidase family)
MISVPYINSANYTGNGYQPSKSPLVSSHNNVTFGVEPQYEVPVYTTKTASVYDDKNLTHTSWFYINDLHGKMTKMERICNMAKEFDATSSTQHWEFFKNTTDDKVGKFKVSSGDIFIGANRNNNKVASQFLNWSGFIASALGNHEMDVTEPGDLSEFIKNSGCKMLALNVEVKPDSPLNGRFQKSIVVERNGEKYGIMGIAPSDMFDRVKINNSLSDIKVENVEQTIKSVQKEIDNLKSQGINKIILLSHSGRSNDKRIAKETDGIDLIFGGHTHDLFKGIEDGVNLLYSKSGEPIVLTQAGKNGEYVGVLNVDFNKNGVVVRAQNNIIPTSMYNRPLPIKDSVEKIIGKPEIVGKVNTAVPMPKHILIEDNPHGNLIADAMRVELDADIALLNTANIRGSFTPGSEIDSRLLADISPFEDKMMLLSLSEKQIVDAIKVGLETSFNNKANKPGILLVSGLKYKCNTKGELLSLEYVDRNNVSHPIDVKNPRTDKKYTVAADDFFATGGDNYLPVNPNPDFVLKTLDYDKNKMACDYIKKLDQPIDIKYDGRLEIVEA